MSEMVNDDGLEMVEIVGMMVKWCGVDKNGCGVIGMIMEARETLPLFPFAQEMLLIMIIQFCSSTTQISPQLDCCWPTK